MSQRGLKSKRNELNIFTSYSSIPDSSSKDDSSSRVNSLSHYTADQETSNNYHNSGKYRFYKSLKSPLLMRKDSDSNDSGFRKYSDYNDRQRTKGHHQQKYFWNYKDFKREEPRCHRKYHQKKYKPGSESSREKSYEITENEGYIRRFSSVEVNQFLPERISTYNFWSSDGERSQAKGDERNERDFELSKSSQKEDLISKQKRKENIEKIEYNIEGSARTRGFYVKKQECKQQNQNKNNADFPNKLEDCEESNENLNSRIHKEIQNRKKSKSAEGKNRLRKVGNSIEKCTELEAKTSFLSLGCKYLDGKETEEIKNQAVKVSSKILDNILKNEDIVKSTTKHSSVSCKNQESNEHSSNISQKNLKVTEENREFDNVNNRNKENISKEDDSKEEKAIFDDGSIMEINEDSIMKKIKKTRKDKIKCQKKRKLKNRTKYKKKNLRCMVIYLMRKLIVSEHREGKSDDKNEKRNCKSDSCISIKQKNKVEFGCESSEYDSLKSIQDTLSENNRDPISKRVKNQSSQTEVSSYKSEALFPIVSNFLNSENVEKSCDNVEFLDSEKYCVYKVYKSSDGEILLKECHSQEFKKGEFIIGKRIVRESEKLQFSKKMDLSLSENNFNQLFSLRNNSTQTELNITTSKKNARKNWYRRSCIKKSHASKKNVTSLKSFSHYSFPESSDYDQVNLDVRKNQKTYSPTSKNSLSHLSKPPIYLLKKSIAVDTNDLNCITHAKDSENKIVLSKNEKSIEPDKECRLLNLDVTTFYGKLKLDEQIKSNVFEEESSQNYNMGILNMGECNFYSSMPLSLIIPVSELKLDNSEFIVQETNIEEVLKVQTENNSNFLQSTELYVKKPELVCSDVNGQDLSLRKKKSRITLFKIFKGKNKYTRGNSEEDKLKIF